MRKDNPMMKRLWKNNTLKTMQTNWKDMFQSASIFPLDFLFQRGIFFSPNRGFSFHNVSPLKRGIFILENIFGPERGCFNGYIVYTFEAKILIFCKISSFIRLFCGYTAQLRGEII